MKFCMECGAPAEDSQKSCRICGHKFPEMEQNPEEAGEEAGEETEIVLDQEDQEEDEQTERAPAGSETDWNPAAARPAEDEATGAVDPGAFGAPEPDEGETVYIESAPGGRKKAAAGGEDRDRRSGSGAVRRRGRLGPAPWR